MREESQRSEDEWWNKGKMGRQRRQMLLGCAASLRILTTVCFAFSCYDIFFVARNHDLSGFLPFGLTEVGVQLTPHNNQWALELNSSKSRTGRPTPLQYKSHTRRESGQCLFSSKSNFFLHFLVLHFCGGVRSQSRPPPGLTLTHTHRRLSTTLAHNGQFAAVSIYDFSVYSEHSFMPRGSCKQKGNLFSWESWEIFICLGHLTKPDRVCCCPSTKKFVVRWAEI